MASCILKLYYEISTRPNDRLRNYSGVFDAQKEPQGALGVEPRTLRTAVEHSTTELYPLYESNVEVYQMLLYLWRSWDRNKNKATFDCCITIWIVLAIYYETYGIIKLSSKDITFQWHYLCIANIFKKCNMRKWAHISFIKLIVAAAIRNQKVRLCKHTLLEYNNQQEMSM